MFKQVPNSPSIVQIPVQVVDLPGHYVHKLSDIEIQQEEYYQRIHNNGPNIQIIIGSPDQLTKFLIGTGVLHLKLTQ